MRRVAMSLCLFFVMLPITRVSAESGNWTSDTFHFSIEWSGNWILDNKFSISTDYASIRLANSRIYYEWYGIFTSRTDPELVIRDFESRFREIDPSQIVQSMSPGGASGPLPEIIAYPNQSEVKNYEYIKAFMSGVSGQAYVEVLGTLASDTTTPVQQLLQDIRIDRSFPEAAALPTASRSSTPSDNCVDYPDWRAKTKERIQALHDILTNLQDGLGMPGLFRVGAVGMALNELASLDSAILSDEPPPIAQDIEPYFQQALSFYESAVRQLSFQPADQLPIFTVEITNDFNNADAYMTKFIAEFVKLDDICNQSSG